MKIAACMICKDSSAIIERAIDSIRPFVDEINVYDTGSTDGTPALLASLGKRSFLWVDPTTGQKLEKKKAGAVKVPLAPIRVKKGEWRDDFAWARQQSFEMASDDVDWFFWLDDDDVIVGAQNLRPLAATAHPRVDGFVMFYDYARDEFGNNLCQLWRERLVRRTPDGQWTLPVHEIWQPHGEGGLPPTYTIIPAETVRFMHERPADQRYPSDRNLTILRRRADEQIAESGIADPRTTCYIGSELMTQQKWEEAAYWLDAYLRHPEASPGDERSQTYHKLAICLREMGKTDAALEVEFQAVRERDDWSENAAGLCEAFFNKGDWARAITWGKRCLELGMPQSMLILNPLELRFLPTVRMAQAFSALGEFAQARACLQSAVSMRPADDMLRGIAQQVEAAAQESEIVQAVLKLREVLIRYDENAKAWSLMASAVPYVVKDHPLVSSAKAMTRENVMHMLKPDEYLRWYEDEPKESTVPDEAVPILGQQIERAGFTLELARKFEEKRGRKPRILDLGANDAWMACFLWAEGGFHCDGIELNKASVEKGRARMERFGAPGTLFQGDIHDAVSLVTKAFGSLPLQPGMLTSGYDIVTCYEVYEHVPDTDRLLSVMESVLGYGGVACVTTPAGAYERGNLEFWHVVERKGHLRAVTPTELADQIVSRGHVEEFRVHQNESLTWAAWRPYERRKRIHIVAPGAWEPWAPEDVRTRGIGGSETCLVHLGLRLSLRGHDVRVFTDAKPGLYGQSVWQPYAAFDPTEEADAIIVSRAPQQFAVDLHAPVRALWCHDHSYDSLTEQSAERITDVVTLSNWQRSRFMRLYPFLEERLRVIRNGVALSSTDGEPRFPHAERGFDERKPVAIYSSSADRGLDVLLALWPNIRQQVPNAELHVFYGWEVFDAVARRNPGLVAYKERVMGLHEAAGGEKAGIFFKGRVGQDALYEAMQEARVWSYPTAFLETSCIGAMEARCSGLPIVTSELGALAETVADHGYLIPWDSSEEMQHNLTDTYAAAFVGRVVKTLTDKEVWDAAHADALRDVADLSWDRRIDDWEALIERSH